MFAQFNFPSGNPSVLKWIAPVSLDTAEVDTEAANMDIEGVTDTLVECVADFLDQDDLDGAIATWSDCVETHLLEHANPKHPVKRYKGRCQSCEPRSVRLGPPRLKGGRPSDFCPSVYSGSVQVRQWTKQVRRLRCLYRACVAVDEGRGRAGLLNNRLQLWQACVNASGFPQGFLNWLTREGFCSPVCLPDLSWINGVLTYLEEQTQQLARRNAADKSGHFLKFLEDSWSAGGSLPFRLLKEPQAPEVLELRMSVTVRLAPQQWLPGGKAWIKVLNPQDFVAGDLFDDQQGLKVVAGAGTIHCPFSCGFPTSSSVTF